MNQILVRGRVGNTYGLPGDAVSVPSDSVRMVLSAFTKTRDLSSYMTEVSRATSHLTHSAYLYVRVFGFLTTIQPPSATLLNESRDARDKPASRLVCTLYFTGIEHWISVATAARRQFLTENIYTFSN